MPSVIPLSAPIWRISSNQLVEVLKDADELLRPAREAALESALEPYRERLEWAKRRDPNDVGFEERELAAAERRQLSADQPHWRLETRRGRLDSPTGSIEEVAGELEIPERYDLAAVHLSGGANAIDITIGVRRLSVTIHGSDAAWLRSAERWANEALKAYRPRWWWMKTGWGYALVAAVASSLPLLTLPIGVAAPQLAPIALIVASIFCWTLIAVAILVWIRPKVMVGVSGMPRIRALLVQGGLLLAGAVLGQLVSVLWRAIEDLTKAS